MSLLVLAGYVLAGLVVGRMVALAFLAEMDSSLDDEPFDYVVAGLIWLAAGLLWPAVLVMLGLAWSLAAARPGR